MFTVNTKMYHNIVAYFNEHTKYLTSFSVERFSPSNIPSLPCDKQYFTVALPALPFQEMHILP